MKIYYHILLIFELVKAFGAYTLIGILLLSFSGLRLSMHSCGGELKSFALYAKAEACPHAQNHGALSQAEEGDCCGEMDSHCKRKSLPSKTKKEKCCDDESIVFEILDIELVIAVDSEWSPSQILPVLHKFENPLSKRILQPELVLIPPYEPPKPPPNLLLWHQVFLI